MFFDIGINRFQALLNQNLSLFDQLREVSEELKATRRHIEQLGTKLGELEQIIQAEQISVAQQAVMYESY